MPSGRSRSVPNDAILDDTKTPTTPTTPGTLLCPQRPKSVREHAESAGHLLEPEWVGQRALVRLGLGEPHFVGYAGPLDGPEDLFGAIAAEARCETAIIDGVIVPDFQDEFELEVDGQGSAVVRPTAGRTLFAAFDLLEIDGLSLLTTPLLERKRHLEGLFAPSPTVRITPFVTRGLAAWHDTLKEQGFRRFVLKDPNSAYSAGQVAGSWLVIEKFGTTARRGM